MIDSAFFSQRIFRQRIAAISARRASRICALALSFCLAVSATFAASTTPHSSGSPRTRERLSQWLFAEDSSPSAGPYTPPQPDAFKPVTVPHVFRQSGLPDDTAGWYRETIHTEPSEANKRFYLELEAAASVKDVYVNGQHIGRHKGAFSHAVFDLTPGLHLGQDNTVDVRVSNRADETQNCFSRSTLYYVNGGMFRPAWLVKTGSVHVFPDLGSTGLYLSPEDISTDAASLKMQAYVRNASPKAESVKVLFHLKGPKGENCGEEEKNASIEAGAILPIEATSSVAHPQLWDLGHPNLYTVQVEVFANGTLTDTLSDHTGFRTIAWKDQRFYLNGREVQFRGVSKHEQTEENWNAVNDDVTRWEWQSMADMGVNAVRLAHYPHRALEYEIADERGIAVWAENGYAGQMWKGPGNEEKTVTPDGERLTREMVRQNWNHPSILFWSAGNETILDVVSHYAKVIRDEDKDHLRLVTYAANGKEAAGCDFVAHNTYDGWYSGHYSQFDQLPINSVVSESGCGDWLTHHVPYGAFKWVVDKFEPEEYAGIFAEYRLQLLCRNDVAERPMFFWWNFREFYNLKFKQNRNTKGLLTLAGTPKDLYYLFQSFYNPAQPVVHLCDREFFLRSFAADNGIKAYSNAPELQLTINGKAAGTMKNGDYHLPDSEIKNKDGSKTPVPGIAVNNVFFWKAPLQPGRNEIVATAPDGRQDRMVIYQTSTAGTTPSAAESLVQDLQSSNAGNPATFIDRPVEPQGAFYTEVDGESDNTFDWLPKEVAGASWIATRRLSDPRQRTDLSFQINSQSQGATVFVLFSKGTYPTVTLKKEDAAMATAADALRKELTKAGFKPTGTPVIWRDHELNRADAELWSLAASPGKQVTIPGQSLDYVVMVQPAAK